MQVKYHTSLAITVFSLMRAEVIFFNFILVINVDFFKSKAHTKINLNRSRKIHGVKIVAVNNHLPFVCISTCLNVVQFCSFEVFTRIFYSYDLSMSGIYVFCKSIFFFLKASTDILLVCLH